MEIEKNDIFSLISGCRASRVGSSPIIIPFPHQHEQLSSSWQGGFFIPSPLVPSTRRRRLPQRTVRWDFPCFGNPLPTQPSRHVGPEKRQHPPAFFNITIRKSHKNKETHRVPPSHQVLYFIPLCVR